MDERLNAFLDELNRHLTGLPELEKNEVMDYYREYINDALDEGMSSEELLAKLDTPAGIAAVIKAETSIRNARSNPGLKSYSKAVKYARFSITRPLSVFLFSILIFISYSIAVPLFIITVASATAACVILPFFIYEALKIPVIYMGEIIGTIGMGVFCSGVMLLITYGFFISSRLMLRLSTGLIARMVNKRNRLVPEVTENTETKRRASRLLLASGLCVITAGLIITLASGLPVKLFTLFNSMKPSNITVQAWEYDAGQADKISIATAHSNIRLEKGNSDKIEIKYEKSDWLEPEISIDGRQLTFSEKSNGRMPLFSLVTMHENRAELTVILPESYKADDIRLESRGGFIRIGTTGCPVGVKTYTGSIFLDIPPEGTAGSGSSIISARTQTGIIQSGGEITGTKTANGTEYELMTDNNGENINLETDRGSIFID